ncbi:6-bladed beta-propeller [Rhodohalobacter sulfatireducens]|uniref:6-bladed beta-propeller n=1 Tax=Rhodohalobacter sulfatireducens TaxID=2911366 RepID=A0ABS9KBP3_9BACT|nr:6-bladed beta-propeller [Rhodohalobacter sulfatireducens]MCG2588233.1 6-bladed beta-propeller [Rhodohalobacter sulfatireducens]
MKSSSNHLHQVISVCLLILLSLTNCSPPEAEIPEHLNELENLVVIQPNSEPASSIEFIRDAVIDDRNATKTWFKDITSGGFPFGGAGWIAGVEVDDSGRIYVGNRPEKTIQVFDSTGSYLTNIGGEGNGPGEFKGITEIRIQSNQLYAFDFLQFRTTFFSLDSLKVDDVKNAYLSRSPDVEELTGWLYNGNKLIDDERFLVRYMDEYANANVGTPRYNLDKSRPGRYYIVDREGKVVSDMLFELKSQKIITADVGGRHLWNMAPVTFLNQPLVSISDDGHIVSANSEESLVKMYAPNGDSLRAFYIPIEKKRIIREELIKLYGEGDEENENLLIHAELPEKWPALGDIILDDENRLWVSTIPDSEDLSYDWWVLQDTGEFLATFRWPGNRSIEKIKDSYLYARETEETTGLQTIVKYRVEITQ